MYGLIFKESDEKAVIHKDTAGFVAAARFNKDSKLRNVVINMIAKQGLDTSDVTVDEILGILQDDLLQHDYDSDKAWNETVYKQMTIENYIIQRAGYAIKQYISDKHKKDTVTIRGEASHHDILVQVTSFDKPLGSNTDGEQGNTLSDIYAADGAEPSESIAIDTCFEDEALDDLVDRLTRFAEWSDTNVNVIVYISTCLSLWCLDDSNIQTVLKQVLSTLGITNYVSIKEFTHNQDFIDIYTDALAIRNKPKFIEKLRRQIFCAQEITETIRWFADEYNKKIEAALSVN